MVCFPAYDAYVEFGPFRLCYLRNPNQNFTGLRIMQKQIIREIKETKLNEVD